MPIKILQLDLVLVSIFKEFVKFPYSSAIVKIVVTKGNLVETNISTVTFRSDKTQEQSLKIPKRFFDQKFDTLS